MSKYITSNPQVLGGVPVIAGTRIPVSRIIYLLKDGYTVEGIREDYPHLNTKILNGVIEEIIQNLEAKYEV